MHGCSRFGVNLRFSPSGMRQHVTKRPGTGSGAALQSSRRSRKAFTMSARLACGDLRQTQARAKTEHLQAHEPQPDPGHHSQGAWKCLSCAEMSDYHVTPCEIRREIGLLRLFHAHDGTLRPGKACRYEIASLLDAVGRDSSTAQLTEYVEHQSKVAPKCCPMCAQCPACCCQACRGSSPR